MTLSSGSAWYTIDAECRRPSSYADGCDLEPPHRACDGGDLDPDDADLVYVECDTVCHSDMTE